MEDDVVMFLKQAIREDIDKKIDIFYDGDPLYTIKNDIQNFIHKTHPDTVWMDIFVPYHKEKELTQYIKENCPEIYVYESRFNVELNRYYIRLKKK